MKKVLYEELLPEEFVQRMQEMPVAYLPLGTLEWHGPHMPLGADGIQSKELFVRVAEKVGGVVLPILFMGPDRVFHDGDKAFYGMDINTEGALNTYHVQQMKEHKITGIDLVAVNLYPFRETIAKPNVTLAEAIENIDIGGPAMVRAAAKNFKFVTIVTNPARYNEIARQVKENDCVDDKTRMELAQEAFAHTASYDDMIQHYLAEQLKK